MSNLGTPVKIRVYGIGGAYSKTIVRCIRGHCGMGYYVLYRNKRHEVTARKAVENGQIEILWHLRLEGNVITD